jgi:phosphoglycerol transferase
MKKLTALILSSMLVLSACGDKPPNPQTTAAAAPAPAVVVYEATLAQGIDFKKDGYPNFISQVAGMSSFEGWGRWSDADASGPVVRFTFKDKLPAAFKLVVTANAFGPNEGKPIQVKAGKVVKELTIKNSAEPGTYIINFANVEGNTLELTPPAPTSPESLNKETPDARKLGIGFVSLKIE